MSDRGDILRPLDIVRRALAVTSASVFDLCPLVHDIVSMPDIADMLCLASFESFASLILVHAFVFAFPFVRSCRQFGVAFALGIGPALDLGGQSAPLRFG